MNEIGAMNNMLGAGLNRVQGQPRPASPVDTANPAAETGAMPNGGTAMTPQTLGGDQLSISPEAYRLSQTEPMGAVSESALDAAQAQGMLQRIQAAIKEDPQSALAVQSGRLNAQRVAALLS